MVPNRLVCWASCFCLRMRVLYRAREQESDREGTGQNERESSVERWELSFANKKWEPARCTMLVPELSRFPHRLEACPAATADSRQQQWVPERKYSKKYSSVYGIKCMVAIGTIGRVVTAFSRTIWVENSYFRIYYHILSYCQNFRVPCVRMRGTYNRR